MIDLAKDVQTYLAAAGLIDGTTDWPSTRGAMHGESDRLVQIADDVGPEPEVHAAEGLGSAALTMPAVLVTVRGKAGERDVTRAKAAAIYDALHSALDITMGSTTYMRVRARSSQPAWVVDDQRRDRFSLSYEAAAAAVA